MPWSKGCFCPSSQLQGFFVCVGGLCAFEGGLGLHVARKHTSNKRLCAHATGRLSSPLPTTLSPVRVKHAAGVVVPRVERRAAADGDDDGLLCVRLVFFLLGGCFVVDYRRRRTTHAHPDRNTTRSRAHTQHDAKKQQRSAAVPVPGASAPASSPSRCCAARPRSCRRAARAPWCGPRRTPRPCRCTGRPPRSSGRRAWPSCFFEKGGG